MLIGLSLEHELTWLPPKEPKLHGRQVNTGTELRALLGSGVGGWSGKWKQGGKHVSIKGAVGREEN